MSVARCRFWKAIFFELLDQLLLPFILSSMLYTGILYDAVENSMQLQGIIKVFRCLSKHNFKSLCFHHYIISPASMRTYLSYKHIREKFIIQNRK